MWRLVDGSFLICDGVNDISVFGAFGAIIVTRKVYEDIKWILLLLRFP